jgi:hypothetical protein
LNNSLVVTLILTKGLVKRLLYFFISATRREINKLLMDKSSDVLTAAQKRNKINNLLNQMANKEKIIKNKGAEWNLRVCRELYCFCAIMLVVSKQKQEVFCLWKRILCTQT